MTTRWLWQRRRSECCIQVDVRDWRIGGKVFVFPNLRANQGVTFAVYLLPLHLYVTLHWWWRRVTARDQELIDGVCETRPTETPASVESSVAPTRRTRVPRFDSSDPHQPPIFVVVAPDRLAPGIVREWCRRAVASGNVPTAKMLSAWRIADQMEAWQREHGSKWPD